MKRLRLGGTHWTGEGARRRRLVDLPGEPDDDGEPTEPTEPPAASMVEVRTRVREEGDSCCCARGDATVAGAGETEAFGGDAEASGGADADVDADAGGLAFASGPRPPLMSLRTHLRMCRFRLEGTPNRRPQVSQA